MITFNVAMFRLFTDGEPISLADNLESLPRADHFPTQRHRWNTNEVCGLCRLLFFMHIMCGIANCEFFFYFFSHYRMKVSQLCFPIKWKTYFLVI